MQALLYLVHRIPYPPNKGDKIRSFHLLKALSKQFNVYLGAFVDNPNDWQYQHELNQYCEAVMLRPLHERQTKLRSLSGLLTGKALSLPYYKDTQMQKWVNGTVRKNQISNIMIFSSTMAQYVEADRFRNCTRIADFVDIDSDKWLQYSRHKSFPMSLIYAREARRLMQYEAAISASFQRTIFVSRDEMQHFACLNPGQASRLGYYKNGVDTNYFDPSRHYDNPYPDEALPIVFTGAMDYWANVEAVCWFAQDSLPHIREVLPQAQFYIVGSNPTAEVRRLQEREGVVVTGAVREIRPYLRHARVIVAPIRIARGVQNKVLEGMAMAKPVVATPMALEGIELSQDYQPLVAHDARDFVCQCLHVLQEHLYDVPQLHARECVLQHYNWERNLVPVLRLFDTAKKH
jgi:sugar transferase (PEP-CTERM/EpsH1 system associated)